jgi:phytoene dehydrogenase-like protein
MDPSLAPQGKQLVHLPGMAPLESTHWKDWVGYHVDYLETIYPGLKNHILWYDFGTTSMINHHSGRIQPDIIGLAQIIGQVGKNRPPLKSPYENLYFVGSDNGNDNIGTELAAESSLRLADLILKK